MICACLTGA